MIILIGSQKGGVGKSTLAVNIAGYLISLGKRAIVIDADDQQSVMTWYNSRDESHVFIPVISAAGNVKQTLIEQNKNYDYVICDSAGRDSKELRTGLTAADIFITPMRPSQMDLDTIAHLAEVFTEAKDWNENVRGYVMLNMCPTNMFINEANETANALADYPEFKLMESRVCDRKVYRDAWGDSITIHEALNDKAKGEIEAVVKEILL